MFPEWNTIIAILKKLSKVIIFTLQVINHLYFIQCISPKVYSWSPSNTARYAFSMMYNSVQGMKEQNIKGSEASLT